MTTDDQRLAEAVRRDIPADPPVPSFEATMGAAEARARRAGRRRGGLAAAALVAAAGFAALFPSLVTETPDSTIAVALLNSTNWSAPSDVLLPEHEFDIYRDLPSVDLSTNSEDGALL